MACRYTYQGKTYEAHEFDDVLRSLSPAVAAKFMPTVRDIPDAPFIRTTDAWLNLALKRIITMAAQEGYDRVAFVNGEQSADRYDLSKQIDRVAITKTGGVWAVNAWKDGSKAITKDAPTDADLANLVGKELAERAIKDGGGEYSGLDLKVGGEGMKAFYDKIVPNATKALLKKLGGGELTTAQINTQGSAESGTGLRIQYRYEGPEYTSAQIVHSSMRAKIDNARLEDQARDVANALRGGMSFAQAMEANGSIALAEKIGGRMVEREQVLSGQIAFDITPAMREKAAQGLPMFSRSPAQTGMPIDAVRAIADRIAAKWTAGPSITVVQTPDELPVANAPYDAAGLMLRGRVYLVASNLANERKVQEAIAHEAIAHHGLREMLGRDGWKQMMANIQVARKAGNKTIREISDDVRRRYVDDAGNFNLTETQEADEIAARAVEMAIDPETGDFRPGLGFLKSVWSKVADFLRNIGINIKFTNAELQGLLVRAMRQMETGKKTEAMPEAVPAYARSDAVADQTETPEFKRWFGDSKVVDEQGRPLVVYHGTGADFNAFNYDTIDSINEGVGFYFTDNKQVADGYGSAKAVYLSIQKPMAYDAAPFKPAQLKQIIKRMAELESQGSDSAIEDGMLSNFGDVRTDGLQRVLNAAVENTSNEETANDQIASFFGAGVNPEYVLGAVRDVTGFDGISADGFSNSGMGDNRIYVAWFPEQIKSATGNRGTFDPENPDIRYSRTGSSVAGGNVVQAKNSPWRDPTGRLQFAPGQWLYDKIGQATGPLLNWKYLQLKAASPELRRMLRDMKLQVERAQETAAAVAGEAFKLTDAERAMVSDLVEKELQAGVQPPAHAVRLAAMINDAMGKQTDELIRLGMLTPETAEKWRGQYLPRYYESKLGKKLQDVWADSIGKMFATPRTAQGIRGKHLRGRGMYQTIPESQLADYEALGWEVRDPDYQPGLATMDGTVQVWRDFTRQERDKMGEIRDAGFRFVMGYMQTQKDIALGRLYEAMAGNPEMSSRTETEKFSAQVPDSKVPGTGAKTYGKMAGRWVSPETLSQLSRAGEEGNEALMMYRKAMSYWKQSKTSLNPVSHANNVISNVTMAHMAGVSYWRPDSYTGAIKDLVTKAPMVKEAKEAGLFLGSMSEAELMNTMPAELRALAGKQDGAAAKAGKTVWDMMTFWLSTPMGKAYKAEDSFFRYLIYRDARGRGLEPADAVDYAQRYIFTYDDLPKGARMIRDFGMPFFAYTYKAIPALLHTALTHPDRMLAPAAVLWTINAAAYAIAAGDDDESWDIALKRYLNDPEFRAKVRETEEMERRYLPEWMKGTTALMTPKVIRLGMDEATNLPLFLDMSRMMPGGDLFDVNPNAGGIPLPQPMTPNHPFFTLATGLLANKDLFRGTELTDSNDTSEEKAAKRADWLWKQLSPAIAVNNYHWERWMNAIAQANGGEVKYVPDALGGDSTGVGRDGLPIQPKLAALQTVGIKLRPIDLETSELIDLNMQRKMVRDIDAEVRRMRRLAGKGAISMKTLETEMEKAAEKKGRLREGLTVDGDERN